MTLLTKAIYGLAAFGALFNVFLGGWFYVFHEFPAAMVDDMKTTDVGLKIFEMLWGGAELANWSSASSYLVYAAMVPAIATAPRWARFPPCFMYAFHLMYAMTYQEARLLAPLSYPIENVVIHAILGLSVLALIALPDVEVSGKSKRS